MWNRECITATSGARKRTCISGVSRVLDRNGPLGPCRRRIKSRKSARVLVHAPLTVTNWASSRSDSTMASGSCRPHAWLNRNSMLRIASSSALVITTSPVLPRSMPRETMSPACTGRGDLFDHRVGARDELVWDFEAPVLAHARPLFNAIDGDDVKFRVLLANLERSLKIGRIVPALHRLHAVPPEDHDRPVR